MSGYWKAVFEFYKKRYENSCSGSILLQCTTVIYPGTKRLKNSNCTVTSLKYLEDNQEIHFHHHCQAHLIYYFIRTRCHYYSTWFNAESRSDPDINFYKPGQTRVTRTKHDPVDPDNPDDLTRFQPWSARRAGFLIRIFTQHQTGSTVT